MRRRVLALLLLPACGGGAVGQSGHPELHFDVVSNQYQINVFATEVDRPNATNQQPFAHPGECDEPSDGWSCDGECPGAWLGELRLEQGGEVLAVGAYDAPFGGGIGSIDAAGLEDAVLVVADLDGAEVEVPIPNAPRPVPTIDDVTITPSGGSTPDDVAITWHTVPAAMSAVVELASGYGGYRCHVERGEDVTTMQAEITISGWSALVCRRQPGSVAI